MLEPGPPEQGTASPDDKDLGVAEWVWLHQRPAGATTDTLPSARALFVPLKSWRGRVGVLALYPTGETRLGDPDERQLLDTFAGLIASAVERTQLALSLIHISAGRARAFHSAQVEARQPLPRRPPGRGARPLPAMSPASSRVRARG